jgi:hypothetical protein
MHGDDDWTIQVSMPRADGSSLQLGCVHPRIQEGMWVIQGSMPQNLTAGPVMSILCMSSKDLHVRKVEELGWKGGRG